MKSVPKAGLNQPKANPIQSRIGQSAHCIVNTMRIKYSTNGSPRQRERKTVGSSKKSWKKKLSKQMKCNKMPNRGLSSQTVSQAELLRPPGLAPRQIMTPIKRNKISSESAGKNNDGNTASRLMKWIKKMQIKLLHNGLSLKKQ